MKVIRRIFTSLLLVLAVIALSAYGANWQSQRMKSNLRLISDKLVKRKAIKIRRRSRTTVVGVPTAVVEPPLD